MADSKYAAFLYRRDMIFKQVLSVSICFFVSQRYVLLEIRWYDKQEPTPTEANLILPRVISTEACLQIRVNSPSNKTVSQRCFLSKTPTIFCAVFKTASVGLSLLITENKK